MVIAFNRNEWKSIIQGAICSKLEQKTDEEIQTSKTCHEFARFHRYLKYVV